MTRGPSLAAARVEKRNRSFRHAATRLTAGFEYIGPALDRATAEGLLS
jgi:hypothetical protein